LGYEEELRDLLRALSDPVPTEERVALVEELLDLEFDSDVDALRVAMTDDDPPLAALAAEYASRCEIIELASEVLLATQRNPWLSAPVDNGPVSVQAPL
jgi:HEAT repeat protein